MKPRKAVTLSSWELVFPNDANPYGSMFGGRLMAIMDKVAAMAAAGYAHRMAVTASTEALHFKSPIHVGDRIETLARVVWVGHTSMVVKVDVFTDNPFTGVRNHCTTAHFNFVAVDQNGVPVPIPPLLLETEEERHDNEVAGIVKKKASRRREEIDAMGGGS